VPQRIDHSNTGNDDSATHQKLLSLGSGCLLFGEHESFRRPDSITMLVYGYIIKFKYPENSKELIRWEERPASVAFIEKCKPKLQVGNGFAFACYRPCDYCARILDALDLGRQSYSIAGKNQPMKYRFSDFGQYYAIVESRGLCNQQAARLSHTFDDQRGGIVRMAFRVIIEGFFAKGNVLDRYRTLAANEFFESIDPKPTQGKNSNSGTGMLRDFDFRCSEEELQTPSS
jgi:hypothetical protein